MKVGFDGSLRLEFHGAKVTSDAGLLTYRDLDEALALFDSVPSIFDDLRTWRNIQHHLTALLRQSVYSRLAGYEDVNDVDRLSVDPTMRRITGKKMDKKKAASANTMSRFETKMLSVQGNLKALAEVNGCWVERAMEKTPHQRIILDMDNSASPVHDEREASAYNGHFCATIPCFISTSSEVAKVPYFGPSTFTVRIVGRKCWDQSWLGTNRKKSVNTFVVLPPLRSRTFMNTWRKRAFMYTIRLPVNDVLQAEIEHLLTRPLPGSDCRCPNGCLPGHPGYPGSSGRGCCPRYTSGRSRSFQR